MSCCTPVLTFCTRPLTFLISLDILQLLEGLLAALENHAVYDVLTASETDGRNAWKQAFNDFYDRLRGAAKDYEMPVGRTQIKNFKSRVVDEIWPLLDSIAMARAKEIVQDDSVEPDDYDEIALDKHLKRAIEQYSTYKSIKASHEEATQQAKETKAALNAKMCEAEEEYHAIPPGVVTQHYSSLTIHPACNDSEDSDDDNKEDDDYDVPPPNVTGRPSDASSSDNTKKHPKKSLKKSPEMRPPHGEKPTTAGDANLGKNPFEDFNLYQEKIVTCMKRMKEKLVSNDDDDIVEKKEKRLKLLYTSEEHHRRMGDVQRADAIKAEITKMEKDVLGI